MDEFRRLLDAYQHAVIKHAYTHDPETPDDKIEEAWERMEKAREAIERHVQELWDEVME